MSADAPEELAVDVDALRKEVQNKYREVALDPHGAHHFHTGRYLARHLGYDDAFVASLPDAAVESFAGVANPFVSHPFSKGERVVDVGSGGGFDSFVAADLVGDSGSRRRHRHDARDAREVAPDRRPHGLPERRVPRGLRRKTPGRRRLGRRRDQQWRDQSVRRQAGDVPGDLPGLAPRRSACSSPISRTEIPFPQRRCATSISGPLESPVVCRVQPGKRCLKTSASWM